MSKALALVGDWNATPADVGRYSPRWLAARVGLRIHSAGPGRHGDIDYVLTDCPTGRLTRNGPPVVPGGQNLGDHDVVSCIMANPADSGDTLKVAIWNVEFGRRPHLVRAQVRMLLDKMAPDVFALQESADYHPELRAVANAAGYRMLSYSGHGKAHNVILVRAELEPVRPKLVQLSPFGWALADGTGAHAPLYAPSWCVAWLRVVDVHMPPSVNWRAGIIYGPVRRVAAYIAGVARLRRWALANRRNR